MRTRRTGKPAEPMPPEITEDPTPYGVVVDGVLVQLQGQPPIAHGGAWWPPLRSGNNTPQ